MGLFNKAREALGQAAAAVSRETEVFSLQSQLGSLDTELEQVMVEVGKRTRELCRAGQLKDPELEVLMRRIETLEAQMMEVRGKVQEAQTPVAPPPPPPATTVAPPAPAVADAGPACPRCGLPLKPDSKFCGECGAKVE